MCMQLLFTKLIYFTDFDTRRLWVKLTIWFRLHLFIFQEVDFPSPLCTPGRGVQCFYKVSSVLRDKIVLTLHPHQDPHQANGKTQNWSEASERKDAEQFIYCDHVSSPHFLHQVRRETELKIIKLFFIIIFRGEGSVIYENTRINNAKSSNAKIKPVVVNQGTLNRTLRRSFSVGKYSDVGKYTNRKTR